MGVYCKFKAAFLLNEIVRIGKHEQILIHHAIQSERHLTEHDEPPKCSTSFRTTVSAGERRTRGTSVLDILTMCMLRWPTVPRKLLPYKESTEM